MKKILIISLFLFCNYSLAGTLMCKLEGIARGDGPIGPHPTGEVTKITYSDSNLITWDNLNYLRLPGQNGTSRTKSGKVQHTYGNDDRGQLSIVSLTFDPNGVILLAREEIKPLTLSVFAKCFKQ